MLAIIKLEKINWQGVLNQRGKKIFKKTKQSHSWKKQRDHQNPALKQNKPEVKVKGEKLLDGDDEELSIEF